MVVRAAKPQYPFALIAPAECHPAVLLRVPQTLPGKGGPDIFLQGCAEEFSRHLEDKIAPFHSQLDTKRDASPVEMPGENYPVLWEPLDSAGAEEVDRALQNAKAAICAFAPCCSWLVEVPGRGPSHGEFILVGGAVPSSF